MKKAASVAMWIGKIVLGAILFALGFSLFLGPNDLNVGGVTGLAMVLIQLAGVGSVGLLSAAMNLPLFLVGGKRLGKRFFIGSALGTAVSSAMIDIFSVIPAPETEPLISALYGGLICGAGLGLVFAGGGTTGGSDIAARLIKLRWRNMPIGQITLIFDSTVTILTGLVYQDLTRTLYSAIAIFVSSKVIDAVVYSFDYSKVALIITKKYEEIAYAIDTKLRRGVTYLYGQGFYSQENTKVILTAVKKQQLAELKEVVVSMDPQAFIIVQEAHQVMGDGFSKYSEDSL